MKDGDRITNSRGDFIDWIFRKKGKGGKIFVECLHCGTVFERAASQIKRQKFGGCHKCAARRSCTNKTVFNYKRGDVILDRTGSPTGWIFLRFSEKDSRVVLAQCSRCKEIYSRNFSTLRNPGRKYCISCTNKIYGSQKRRPKRAGSMRSASVEIGKSFSYFSQMKIMNPRRFEKIKKLGNGDLVRGWEIEQSYR